MNILNIDELNSEKIRYNKLQKKNDIIGELTHQSSLLTNSSKQILDISIYNDHTIIVYRSLFDLPETEEYAIFLNIKVITKKGVIYPEPTLHATRWDDEIHLGDIRIFGENQNKGYGSILISALKGIAVKNNIRLITGFISSVDVDHMDRLRYFYEKHGFSIDEKYNIKWINTEVNVETSSLL